MNPTRKQRVLLLYKVILPSVLLCGHTQLTHLASQSLIEYRHKPSTCVSCDDLDWADIILLCRLDNAYELRLARLAKQAGKHIFYIIDDDLLNIPAGLSSAPYYKQRDVRRSISGMLAMCDAVISPSPVLLAKYAANKGILLEEPAIAPLPYVPRNHSTPFRIGFAGSVDRTGDIEHILKDALLRIRNEYGTSVEFFFFGAVPSFATALGSHCIPYCDSYENYRTTLNSLQLDIGLAPMPDTPFHACKHYNKFVEYAAAGAVGIFSNVSPYDRLKNSFGWEFLCANNADAWYTAIKQLLDNPERLDSLKHTIAKLTAGPFSVPHIASDLANKLAQFPTTSLHDHSRISISRFLAAKILSYGRRGWNCLKRYGFKTPAVVFSKVKALSTAKGKTL